MRNLFLLRTLAALLLALTIFLCSGCGGHHHASARVPASPPALQTNPRPVIAPNGANAAGESAAQTPQNLSRGPVLYSETGWASWYGPSYNHRRAANGEIYEQNDLTAAHRTIPLNSVARVTNLATGESVVVRITDRGPFVSDRIIDLSMGAAKKIGVYLRGTAKVRVDVLQSPTPVNTGGRWAVQMGAFEDSDTASEIKEKLARRYRDAKVLQFVGPRHDWWVRVRVPNDNKGEALEVARDTRVPEGAVFLVRLD